MRFAAIVFLVSGLAYLGWDLSLTFSQGMRVGSWLMAVIAVALLFQAYELFRNKPGARWRAIVSSAAIVICSGYIVSAFFMSGDAWGLVEALNVAWPVIGGASFVFVVHSSALVLLTLNKSRPNQAFNPGAQKQRAG